MDFSNEQRRTIMPKFPKRHDNNIQEVQRMAKRQLKEEFNKSY